MSGFVLDENTRNSIVQVLPDIDPIQKKTLRLAPDFISMKYRPESNVPMAAVCLDDATSTLFAARYALYEALANKIWYLEKCENPDVYLATSLARYYLDDVALRLYSAGEHLANAIIFMLEITDSKLEQYRDRHASQQSIVGNYLAKEVQQQPITQAVVALAKSKEWQDTINYRTKCVHYQPPTVEGLGIVYRRRIRWQKKGDGKSFALGIGGGDEPEYRIDDILHFIRPALAHFADVVRVTVDYYIDLLAKHGISYDEKDGLRVHFPWIDSQ